MLKRIDHINIVVSDLTAAESFFAALGFRRVQAAALDGAFISSLTGLESPRARFTAMALEGSATTLELIHYEQPRCAADPQVGQANRPGVRHLAFAVDDIEKTVAALEGNGVRFHTPIRCWEKTGKRLVYFEGPDGILLELA